MEFAALSTLWPLTKKVGKHANGMKEGQEGERARKSHEGEQEGERAHKSHEGGTRSLQDSWSVLISNLQELAFYSNRIHQK